MLKIVSFVNSCLLAGILYLRIEPKSLSVLLLKELNTKIVAVKINIVSLKILNSRFGNYYLV
jgi:hypothetical protein